MASARAITLAQAATRATGEPLRPSIRTDMERRFGHDFGHVRVYADERAAASADLLDAPAYSSGSDIVFGAEQYLPETGAGQELLLHELAHVVQSDLGALAGSPALDEGPSDPSEQDAKQRAHDAAHEPHEHDHAHSGPCECPKCRAERGLPPLPGTDGECCGKAAGHHDADAEGAEHHGAESEHAFPSVAVSSVHRAPWEQRRDPGSVSGHTAGSDYQGPSGVVTRQGKDSASLGGNTALGGAVSYGCYCGPGGDPTTGSRCGPNAPAVDEIDEQCRQHDTNYGLRGVDSGDVPGKANMWSLEGWLNTSDADERLRSTVERAMDEHPESFSPSAQLYGQGIKGIFGARSRTAEGYKWGSERVGEAEQGLTGAYDSATSFLSDRYGAGSSLLGDNLGGAASFAQSTLGRAGSGVENFLSSASGWNSAGDVASGLWGGATDALGFIGGTEAEGLRRAAGGIGDIAGFAGDTLTSGGGGALDTLGRGASWAGNTFLGAAGGIGGAALDVNEWGSETAGALGGVGLDLLGRGASSLMESASHLSPRDIAGPLIAPPAAEEWLKSLW